MTLRLTALTLLAFAATTPGFAQEGTQDFANQTLSTRSRNEVRIELAKTRVAGELENRGQAYGGFARTEIASTKTRAQVVAELDTARRAGELENRGETYGSFAPDMASSATALAKARAALAQAKAANAAERAVRPTAN